MRERRRGRLHMGHERADRWLVSYADYMTLIFALFVVLYAMAMYQKDKYPEFLESLKQVTTGMVGEQNPIFEDLFPNQSASILTENRQGLIEDGGPDAISDDEDLSELPELNQEGAPFHAIETQLQREIHSQGNEVKMEQRDQWLTIELDSRTLFPSGSASLTPSARVLLLEIGKVLAGINNYLRVRGYTDDQLVRNELFPSNWELSAARSVSVLKSLVNYGIAPQRLAIEAFGQYRPLVPNQDEISRARNRRVVIAVSKRAWIPPKVVKTPLEPAKPPEAPEPEGNDVREIPLPGGGFVITTRKDAAQ